MDFRCLLGRVSCPTEGVTVDEKLTHGNSNKWIFEITAPAEPRTVEVILLDFRSGKPKPRGLLLPHATPLNAAAAQALIFFPEPDRILMQVEPGATGWPLSPLRFRVVVDGLHTLMR